MNRRTAERPATPRLAPIAAPEHERALLRCYLDRPADILDAPAALHLFSDPQHAAVYGAMRDLVTAGEMVDILTVTAKLRERGSRVPASTVADIAASNEAVTPTMHLGILRECEQRRLLHAIARDL